MAVMPIGDKESGAIAGYLEIPEEVVKAALIVSDWLQTHPAVELYGLKFVDGDEAEAAG